MNAQNEGCAPRGMTRAELLALPAAIDLETANRALSLGRTKGYQLAKCGLYPCEVLRVGGSYRVVTASLLSLLGIEDWRAQVIGDAGLCA
jgi:hypothetical protein